MKSAFEQHRVDQALAKMAKVIHHPSGGHGAPSWAEAHSKDVLEGLRQLESRMRAHGMTLQHGALPVAVYAARELNKYFAGASSDIANKDAAEVFYRCLRGGIEELRSLDQELAGKDAA